jgi:hypothetical protein
MQPKVVGGRLSIVGLAAALPNPLPWATLLTYINESGEETVVQAKLKTGQYAPLIAADITRVESMMPAARDLMRLIKFTSRLDIEDITP